MLSKDDAGTSDADDDEDWSCDVIPRNKDRIFPLHFLLLILRQSFLLWVGQKEIHTLGWDDAGDDIVLVEKKKVDLKEKLRLLLLRLKIQRVFDEEADEGNTDLLESTESKDGALSRHPDSQELNPANLNKEDRL
jgi:hypothetical protein